MNLRRTHRCIPKVLRWAMVAAAFCAVTWCQEAKPQDQLPAPPPMKTIPEVDRIQLNESKDPKAHIRRIIELADLHLQRAETAATQQRYDASLMELGNYLALIEDGFKFLAKMNSDRGKARDHYKHLELALRAQGPRLTAMRRATPLEYALRMKEVEDFAREGRTDALNAFYGHTVVRDGHKKLDEDDKPKTTPKPERQP
ncbi:MAG: hypothetical protein JWM21_2987 [Acidobacteria bacterium]|nr:hypothetical protein [Acidobacteriota bacterium]